MILMVGVTAAGCGKKPSKAPAEPNKVETVTPTDGVTPTNTVAPTEVPGTPTPTPIESKITTKTEPSSIEGYTEITSLSARDIKEDSMLQEYDRILDAKEYAESMDLTDITSKDLAGSLAKNTELDAEIKNEVADIINTFDVSKLGIPGAALYANLSDVKVVKGNFNTGNKVAYDVFTNTIYVSGNLTAEEMKKLLTIGLGFATLERYEVNANGDKVLNSPSTYCYDESGNIIEVGGDAKKALAQIIANKATGKNSVSPDDLYYPEVVKLTVALNTLDPEKPYTYERCITEGYKAAFDAITQFEDKDDLLSAEDAYKDTTSIPGVEVKDERFIETYNFVRKMIKLYLDDLHSEGIDDFSLEAYYMKFYIGILIDSTAQGMDISSTGGYIILEDGTIVIEKLTMESLKAVLETALVNEYKPSMTK